MAHDLIDQVCAALLQRDQPALAYRQRLAATLKAQASGVVLSQASLTSAVDAAMMEMQNISPPLGRGECARLIRAAFARLNSSPVSAGDREALIYLMDRFDNEVWVCTRCSHEETTNGMDSASYLREYLAGAQPVSAGGVDERAAFEAWYLAMPYGSPNAPPAKCCSPTDQELEQLKNGDYTPQELWGASEPSCPKCVRKPT